MSLSPDESLSPEVEALRERLMHVHAQALQRATREIEESEEAKRVALRVADAAWPFLAPFATALAAGGGPGAALAVKVVTDAVGAELHRRATLVG